MSARNRHIGVREPLSPTEAVLPGSNGQIHFLTIILTITLTITISLICLSKSCNCRHIESHSLA